MFRFEHLPLDFPPPTRSLMFRWVLHGAGGFYMGLADQRVRDPMLLADAAFRELAGIDGSAVG